MLALALLAAGRGPEGGSSTDSRRLPSPGVELLEGDGFSLHYPAGARLQTESAEPPARQRVRIVGPEIAIRPVGADWTMAGAAYVLDVAAYENPKGLTAAAWVEENILRGREALSPPRVDSATVAGEPAVRVTMFGGDSEILTCYLARGERVVALQYADSPPGNSPIAPVQRDIYALILGSFRWNGEGSR